MREIAIFESQKHYVQRISDDEKINIFKSIWPNSLHTFGEITLLFDDIMYTSKTIKKFLKKEKEKNFINNILSCNLF
tara:strand:- start:15553 stop:15783 length:231 start_codon:yes stop_codon:yes gene_type:complete